MYPPPQNTENLGCGPLVMGLTWTFTGLAIITTLLRLYVRRRIGPRLAVDDWLMLGAMVSDLHLYSLPPLDRQVKSLTVYK